MFPRHSEAATFVLTLFIQLHFLAFLSGQRQGETGRYIYFDEGGNRQYCHYCEMLSLTVQSQKDQVPECIQKNSPFGIKTGEEEMRNKWRPICSSGTIPSCPVLNLTVNGKWKCSESIYQYNEIQNGYIIPVYTQCNLTCSNGYEISDVNSIYCNESLQWDTDVELIFCVGIHKKIFETTTHESPKEVETPFSVMIGINLALVILISVSIMLCYIMRRYCSVRAYSITKTSAQPNEADETEELNSLLEPLMAVRSEQTRNAEDRSQEFLNLLSADADLCGESRVVDTWGTKELSTVTVVPNVETKHGVLKQKEELPKWKELDELETVVIDTSAKNTKLFGFPYEPKSKDRDYWEKSFLTVEEEQQSMSGTDQIFPKDGGKDGTKRRTSCPEIIVTNKTPIREAKEYSFVIPVKEIHPVKSGINIAKVMTLNENVGHEGGNGVTSLIKEIDTILGSTEAPSVQQTMSVELVTSCVSEEQNNLSKDCTEEEGDSSSNDELAKRSYTRIRKQYRPKMRRTVTCYRNIKFFKGKVEKKKPIRLVIIHLPLGNDTHKMTTSDKSRDSKRENIMTVVEALRKVIPQSKKTGSFEWMTPCSSQTGSLESYYQTDKKEELEVCQQSIQSNALEYRMFADNLISSNDQSIEKPSAPYIERNAGKTHRSKIQILDMNSGKEIIPENEQNSHKSSDIFGPPNENRNEISSCLVENENVLTNIEITQFEIDGGNSTKAEQEDITSMEFTTLQNQNKLENSFDNGDDEKKISEVQRPQSFKKGSTNESLLVYEDGSNRSSERKSGVVKFGNHEDAQKPVKNLSGPSENREETFDSGKDGHKLIENQTQIQKRTCPDKYGRIQNIQEYQCSRDSLEKVAEDEDGDKSTERNTPYKEKRIETPPDDKDSDESIPELQILQSESGTDMILQNRKDSNKLSDYPISQTRNLKEKFDNERDVDNNPERQTLQNTSENSTLFSNEDKSDGSEKNVSLRGDSKGKIPTDKEGDDQETSEKQILEREGRHEILPCNEGHSYESADKQKKLKKRTVTDIEDDIKPSIHQRISTSQNEGAYISSENCKSSKNQGVSHIDDAYSITETSAQLNKADETEEHPFVLEPLMAVRSEQTRNAEDRSQEYRNLLSASGLSGSVSFVDAVKYAIKNGDHTNVHHYLETQAWEHEDEIHHFLEYSLAFKDGNGTPTMTMVFLSWICKELTKRHESYKVTVWPATFTTEDRSQELPVLVCNYWDDVKEIYRDRCFFGLSVKYQEYNTVNDEELFVQNSKEFEENKLSQSDAILANEIVSQNTNWLINRHSNLEAIKPCHIRCIRSEVFYETCIVLHCRMKGYIPFSENLFPTTLTFGEMSLPVDVREEFFVPAMMQENSFFTNAGGNLDAHAGCDEEAWDRDLFRMGVSMGPNDKPISATVGPFVRIGENNVGFLTCAHPFGIPCNVDSALTQPVVSPANEECAPIHKDDFVPIHNNDPTCGYIDKIRFDNDYKHEVNVDAALIQLSSNKQPQIGRFPWMKPCDLEQAGLRRDQILKFDDGEIVKKATLEQGKLTGGKFIKVGAGSGVTSSNYLGHEHIVIKFRQKADLAHEHGSFYPPIIGGTRCYIMKGQYVIHSNSRKNFITLGDSGSGVFHMDDQRKLRCIGIGIGFMSYGKEAVVTPIEDVLEALGLREDALMKFSSTLNGATRENDDQRSN